MDFEWNKNKASKNQKKHGISFSEALEKSRNMRKDNMSKTIETDDLSQEYDFSDGVRSKHYQAYKEGTNLVLLDPDTSKVFKDSESVNHALRMPIELAGKETKRNITK